MCVVALGPAPLSKQRNHHAGFVTGSCTTAQPLLLSLSLSLSLSSRCSISLLRYATILAPCFPYLLVYSPVRIVVRAHTGAAARNVMSSKGCASGCLHLSGSILVVPSLHAVERRGHLPASAALSGSSELQNDFNECLLHLECT